MDHERYRRLQREFDRARRLTGAERCDRLERVGRVERALREELEGLLALADDSRWPPDALSEARIRDRRRAAERILDGGAP